MKRISVLFIAAFCISLSFAGIALARPCCSLKFFNEVTVEEDETVEDVIAVFSPVTVFGKVNGELLAIGSDVYLKAGSVVKGSVISIGGDIIRDATAAVEGKEIKLYIPRFLRIMSLITAGTGILLAVWPLFALITFIGIAGFTALMGALIPERLSAMADILDSRFLKAFLIGMAAIILTIPIIFMLVVTIIGIIFIPLYILVILVVYLLGYSVCAVYIGKKTLTRIINKKSHIILEGVVGLVLLYIVGYIPVVGFVIKLLFLAAGTGAVLISRFGQVK